MTENSLQIGPRREADNLRSAAAADDDALACETPSPSAILALPSPPSRESRLKSGRGHGPELLKSTLSDAKRGATQEFRSISSQTVKGSGASTEV